MVIEGMPCMKLCPLSLNARFSPVSFMLSLSGTSDQIGTFARTYLNPIITKL